MQSMPALDSNLERTDRRALQTPPQCQRTRSLIRMPTWSLPQRSARSRFQVTTAAPFPRYPFAAQWLRLAEWVEPFRPAPSASDRFVPSRPKSISFQQCGAPEGLAFQDVVPCERCILNKPQYLSNSPGDRRSRSCPAALCPLLKTSEVRHIASDR